MTSIETKQIARDMFETNDSVHKKPKAKLNLTVFNNRKITNSVRQDEPRKLTRTQHILLYSEKFEQVRAGCEYLCGKATQKGMEEMIYCATPAANLFHFVLPKALLNQYDVFEGYLINSDELTFKYDLIFDEVLLFRNNVLVKDAEVECTWV